MFLALLLTRICIDCETFLLGVFIKSVSFSFNQRARQIIAPRLASCAVFKMIAFGVGSHDQLGSACAVSA